MTNRKIAFTRNAGPLGTSNSDTFVMNVDGSGLHRVSKLEAEDVSPNRSSLSTS